MLRCAQMIEEDHSVHAIGVNCTAPKYIAELVKAIRSATEKPIFVYPNSGEQYDVETRQWSGERDVKDYADYAKQWWQAGANVVGGCCRVTPAHIAGLRDARSFDS